MRRIAFYTLLAAVVAPASVAAGTHSQPVQLVLQIERKNYAPREPVTVEYSLINTSHSDATVPSLIGAQTGWIRFEVSTAEGQFEPYRTGIIACPAYRTVTLKPGDRLSSQLIIATNGYNLVARGSLLPEDRGISFFPFSEFGTYKIRAVYPLDRLEPADQRAIATSNTIELSVRPASEHEKDALAFFSSQDEFAVAIGGDGERKNLSEDARRWEDFVTRFPGLPYTPYVRLNLGILYLKGAVPPPTPDRAAEHLRSVADSGPKAIADDALVELTRSQISTGRVDEARKTITRFLERFPQSERKGEVVRLRDGLARGLRSLQEIYGN